MHSLNQFHSLYEDHLKEPSCLAICMEDLCSGWNTETFKQILSKMTLKSSTCVPLFYLKHEELRIFSNKNNTLQEVFKLFDTRGLSRIDGMELVCSMAMISSGPLISKIEACFYAFSVNEENKFDRNQFCFFMDCLCRGLGLNKIILVHTDTFYPRSTNARLSFREIELIADSLFKTSDSKISPHQFYEHLMAENGPLMALFTVYPGKLQKCQENYRDLMNERIKIVSTIKSIIQDLIYRV